MMIGTITVYRQYLFLTNSDLGFDKEAVFTVPIPTREAVLMERFKSTLLQNPAIKDVSLSNSSPARSANWTDLHCFPTVRRIPLFPRLWELIPALFQLTG
ncbi:MAG: hypothetical protein IPF54_24520 [Draconibacterium sp.]|nr:hypothetical protein [Draconibacterium sp.]